MFAVVFVPNFKLQAVLRSEPGLGARAVALIDAAADGASLSQTVVLECTATAEVAGVSAGLSAPQAMARCRDLLFKGRSVSAEQSATDILLQTAYAFSPHIEHTAPGVGTIDLRGLDFERRRSGDREDQQESVAVAPGVTIARQRTFDLEEAPCCAGSSRMPREKTPPEARARKTFLKTWSMGILTALRSLGLEARIGVGDTPSLALLAAQAARPLLVVTNPESFFTQLPIEALQPSGEVLNILKRWGIHTAGVFLALGKDAIAARLGAEALALFERASPTAVRPLNLIVPADAFEEQMQFEAHIETIEPLLFVLRRFVEQLATRIAVTYRVVAEIELTLTLESGGRYQRNFKVPSPTARIETLFRMLHTHLENLRTDAPIVALQLGAVPVRAEAQQFGLFESALRDPNHFHETLARLTAMLGPERVGTPVIEQTHRPDSFHLRAPDFHGRNSAPAAERGTENVCPGLCLRRFRPPVRAEVEAREGQPAFLSAPLVSSVIVEARGPWDASGHWWDNRRWLRQEWDVMTRDGTMYRLCHADGEWRVEGVYD